MHSRMAPLVAGCIAVFATQVFATQVFAQGANPSADQIIKSLTPTGDMSKTATRGIRLSQPTETGDAAAPAAGAHKATGHAAVASMKPMGGTASPSDAAPSVNLTVNFATGSAELTPQAMQSLDVLGIALSSDALAHYRFRVEGHTDTVGTPEANRVLSEKRAQAVADYISKKFNIAADRLEPVGMGESKPLVATAAQVPEPRNRRVQIVNIGT